MPPPGLPLSRINSFGMQNARAGMGGSRPAHTRKQPVVLVNTAATKSQGQPKLLTHRGGSHVTKKMLQNTPPPGLPSPELNHSGCNMQKIGIWGRGMRRVRVGRAPLQQENIITAGKDLPMWAGRTQPKRGCIQTAHANETYLLRSNE